jgi:hypothetical protein
MFWGKKMPREIIFYKIITFEPVARSMIHLLLPQRQFSAPKIHVFYSVI